jgi:hypothetical protein
MAQKFLTNIDLNQNQLINAKFEALATNPSSGNFEGRMYFNTATFTLMVYANAGWKKSVHSIVSGGGAGIAEALTVSESNGTVTLTLNVADTDSAGLLPAAMWNMLTDATPDATSSKLVKRDGSGNAKVATPTDPAHIATKGYVDAARQGLDVKQSVRVATTAAVNLAADLQTGDVIDGVTLAAGDRVLVKNQVSGSENGIYVAVASGTALRSSDANGTVDTGELKPGTFAFVEEGTVNSDKGFVVSTNGAITIDSTAIAWTQFSGAGSFEAGDGLSQSGNTINVNVTSNRTAITADAIDISANYVGQTSITTLGTITTGVWDGTDVAVTAGGTNSSTASGARTNLAADGTQGAGVSVPVLARVVAKVIGDGSATSFGVQHGFATRDVLVQVYDAATYDTVICDVVRTDTNNVTVTFSVAPTLNSYRVVITG